MSRSKSNRSRRRLAWQHAGERRSVGGRRAGGPWGRPLRIEMLEDRRLLALVTVNTLTDSVDFNDGVTSLREAIFATNLVGGADTIDFAPALTAGGPATILLTQGELAITDSLTINGPGANLLTIDASGNDPTSDVNNGDGSRIFNIDDDNSGNLLDISLSSLTLTGGDVGRLGGGAIRSLENLTVTDSTISGNSASGFSQGGSTFAGGGIYSNGNLTIIRTTIGGNTAGGDGGGIRTVGGSLVLTDSTLNENVTGTDGGAISSTSSSVTVTSSMISGNSASNSGGGIWKSGSGSLTVSNTTISDNSARNSGGIFSNGNLTVTGSTISGNSAVTDSGGIHSFYGNLVVTNSTISGNSAGRNGGGILEALGSLTVTWSTISGNSAANDSGGIRASGFIGAVQSLSHTIVVGNTRGPAVTPSDVTGRVAVAFSLLGVDTGATITDNGGNLIGTAAAPIDPLLGPLTDTAERR